MLLSSISPGPSPTQDLQPEAAASASGGPDGSAAGGADSFASRLAQALDGLPQGQNLAADGTPLTRLPLGASMELITVGSEQPDGESLAAFAAAQGLDPEVVAWLFSEGGEGGKPGPAGESKEAKAEGALDAALQAGMLTPQGLLIPLPPQGSLPLADGAAGAAEGGEALPGTLLGAALMPGWLGQQAEGLTGGASEGQALAAAQAAVPDAAGSFAAAQALASAGLANQVVAKQEINTPVDIGSKSLGMPVEILSLEVDPFALSLLEDSEAPVHPEDGPSADAATANGQPLLAGNGQGSAASQAAAADPASEAAQASAAERRAEALHTLAQRLGEAVGQRVLGQIARGNWSMKLVLKPATLGDVEVDLRMRSGELDAAFRTMNPMTRELLADGLPRLREVLAGAGMDIAGLHVGHGSSQNAGGNPTPQQSMAGANNAQATGNTARGAEPVAPTATAPVRRSGSANWDVLV